MPLIATEGESKPRQLPPEGTHVARCFSVIDLGTQTLDYMGQSKSLRKLRITWELPDEKAVFNDEKGEQPFVISKDYTLSLYEKANLRHDLESWRGKQFSEDELKGFDIFNLLGVACLLTIVHKTKGDKTYANVTSVSKLPKAMMCAPPVNKRVEYSIDDGRNNVFDALPEWLRKKIETCGEWNEQSVNGDEPIEREESSEVPF